MNTIHTFLFLLILFFVQLPACTQSKNNKNTISQKDSSSQKPAAAQNEQLNIRELQQDVPAPKGRVNDFAGLLTQQQINSLDSIIMNHEKKTKVEIAVVTLDSSYVTAENFDNYSLILALKWGVGKKENSKGILIAISADLRRIRIRNGTGIEKIISNADTQQIIDQVSIPHFRNGEFFEGLKSTILELISKTTD